MIAELEQKFMQGKYGIYQGPSEGEGKKASSDRI